MSKIVIENGYFEVLNTEFFETLINKSFPIDVGYFLGVAVNELTKLSETYFKSKDILINKYAIKNEKGESIVEEDNKVKIKETEIFMKELKELSELKNTLNSDKIEVDLEELKKNIPGGLTIKEMRLLIPFITPKKSKNDTK